MNIRKLIFETEDDVQLPTFELEGAAPFKFTVLFQQLMKSTLRDETPADPYAIALVFNNHFGEQVPMTVAERTATALEQKSLPEQHTDKLRVVTEEFTRQLSWWYVTELTSERRAYDTLKAVSLIKTANAYDYCTTVLSQWQETGKAYVAVAKAKVSHTSSTLQQVYTAFLNPRK